MFPNHWARPVRGAGGVLVPEDAWVERPNAWAVLHSRYTAAVASVAAFGPDRWNEASERVWLRFEWVALIPKACGCQDKSEKLDTLLSRIDLATAESAERSAFELHNWVSVNHVDPPKPTIDWGEYRRLYPISPMMREAVL